MNRTKVSHRIGGNDTLFGSSLEGLLLDQFNEGKIDRREFLRRGSVLGMSLTFLGGLVGGADSLLGKQSALAAAPGGTIRVAQGVPGGGVEPVKLSDSGGTTVLSVVGEYLCVSGPDLVLQPQLAESWSPNNDGTVWTFKIRNGVKFHNGKTMTASDVAATFNRLADPDQGSNALSVFKGYLSKGNAKAIDESTVEFRLDQANGNFPYFTSTDNYNAVILPEDYDGNFEKDFNGTGPFKIEKYTPKVGASFIRNPDYWGEKALPERVELQFFGDIPSQILALQAGDVDVIQRIPVSQAITIQNSPDIKIISIPSTAHFQVHMNTEKGVFADARVRRALALSIDRSKLVDGLMRGKAVVGNDSPFASIYPSTNPTVPQRVQDIAEAKKLMKDAGFEDGFDTVLTTEKYLEIPDYAVLIQNMAKEIGIRISINLLDQGAYYGDAVQGKSPWLDSDLGITDYGHRGVPNVVLSAPLLSDGAWNSARFKSKDYDDIVRQYVAAFDLDTQQHFSGMIQKLLLEETPIIFGFFYDYLSATQASVSGVKGTAMGQLFLAGATKS